MFENYHILSDDNYGNILSYTLNNEVEGQIESIVSILTDITKELSIIGTIEVYVRDGFLLVDLPSPYVEFYVG